MSIKRSTKNLSLSLILAASAAACGGSDKEPAPEASCNADPAVCGEGTVCEQLGESAYMCLPPVLVRGRVFDARTEGGLEGATIVALDANGAARSRVARSLADGSYELPVSVRRADDGAPLTDKITLRVGADDFQTFPTPPRTSLAIDLVQAVQELESDAGSASADAGIAGPWVVENAATDVALIALPEGERTGVSVEGKVSGDDASGVLVLAVQGEHAAASAISDSDGSFVLFNVPEGSVALQGYRAGLSVVAKDASVPAAGLRGVVLEASASGTGTVSGNINIVNAEGSLTTSVILVVASSFDADNARGEAPAGLRVGNISGAFSIEGVPAGRYAVLAAFENDRLVRDPDEAIAGTSVVFVDVTAGGTVQLEQSFKVTEALAVEGPGAENVEQMAAGMLPLRWADDSSEDGYELRVYDALGTLVHEDLGVPRVSGGAGVSYMLDATRYQPGMIYQFRVKSWRESRGKRSYISATEDLRGVFELSR